MGKMNSTLAESVGENGFVELMEEELAAVDGGTKKRKLPVDLNLPPVPSVVSYSSSSYFSGPPPVPGGYYNSSVAYSYSSPYSSSTYSWSSNHSYMPIAAF